LFFRAVADQAGMPILIQNPKPKVSVRLERDTIETLARHPAIVGVLEESGDISSVRDLLDQAGKEFQVLIGDGTLLTEGLSAGASGAAPPLANAAPFFCLSIEEAVRTRELTSAEDLQRRANPASAAITRYGVAGLKYAMDLRGYYGGSPRLPLLGVTEEAKAAIAAAFHGVNS
jgi:4-hydroxy-2-oxoglutarate aldolase